MQETWVGSLGQEDPLEKGMATHSSILGLYSMQVNSIPCLYPTLFEQINCLPLILQCMKGKVLV